MLVENLDKLWPLGTRADRGGELWIGGCAASALAASYGTPLYVFDETTLRTAAQTYRAALAEHYAGPGTVAYAAKAYLTTGLAQLFAEEGLELDVVSGGELYVALEAGVPPSAIHFHGNNKTAGELAQAVTAGVGRIVVDNLAELDLLAALLPRLDPPDGGPVRIWLRLAPGIDAHTHSHIQTGRVDTKFGLSIADGDAETAVAQALATPGLALVGLHAHIGSQ
ncbi:MAG TPA: diaminopimelate decarboxylase, partial [Anaerolineae bacterium]